MEINKLPHIGTKKKLWDFQYHFLLLVLTQEKIVVVFPLCCLELIALKISMLPSTFELFNLFGFFFLAFFEKDVELYL